MFTNIEELKSDVTLKDSTIAILLNEKSQLREREQSIRDGKDLTGIQIHIIILFMTIIIADLTSQFKEMESIVDGLLSKQQKILSQSI